MPKTTPKQIETIQKEAEAVKLRLAGHTFDQIAQRLGYSDRSGAAKAVRRAMQATIQEPTDELRRIEVERLDALQRALWPAAESGKWLATDRVLTIMDRRARLLGLDAPQRRVVNVIVEDVIDAEIKRLEAKLADNDEPSRPVGDRSTT